MRVVIADDESLVRFSLRSMLLESDFAVNVVGEAKNGDELVALVRKSRPDLAFVDIRMPKLDGLAAIAKGSSASPNTHWVILTSYSEFEYAKQAVRLGVSDYLLKPVGPDELRGALERQAKAFAEERAARADEFEGALGALLNRTAPEGLLDERYANETSGCAAVILLVDGGAPDRPAAHAALAASLRAAARELASVERPVALVPLPAGNLCAAMAWAAGQSDAADAAFRRLANRVSQIASGATELLVTTVVTGECGSFGTLAREVWRVLEVKGLRAVAGAGGALASQALLDLAAKSNARRLSERIDDAVDAAGARMPLALLAALNDVERLMRDSSELGERKTQAAVARFLSCVLPSELERPADGTEGAKSSPDPFAWLQALRARVERSMRKSEGVESTGDLVDQVRAYVDQRFAEELRIADVARLLRVTPNYLSNLFHKKIGKTFVHYLTERRMEHAQELLRTRRIQVQVVARSVGYRSTRHFTRVFKAHCGVYPSDYRALHRAPEVADARRGGA